VLLFVDGDYAELDTFPTHYINTLLITSPSSCSNTHIIEIRVAVVEVGHPWKDTTVQRKLPPLKYTYDFEMSKWKVCWYGASV
jgi:hypothetical protein